MSRKPTAIGRAALLPRLMTPEQVADFVERARGRESYVRTGSHRAQHALEKLIRDGLIARVGADSYQVTEAGLRYPGKAQ